MPVNFTFDEFNEYFLSCCQNLLSLTYNDKNLDTVTDNQGALLKEFCKQKLNNSKTFFKPRLEVHEVGKLISDLKNKRSMGPDDISTHLLKLILPYIIEPLTFAYNLCIE